MLGLGEILTRAGVYKYNAEKTGSNIIFPIIMSLLERISSGEEDGKFREENQDFK